MTIREQWEACRAGLLPTLVARLPSGFVTLFDQQTLPGYCVLIADPLVGAINDLDEPARGVFLCDLAFVGDAIPRALGRAGFCRPVRRLNYAMLGNVDPTLHAHVMPRFEDEGPATRDKAYWAFPPTELRPEDAFDPRRHGALLAALRDELAPRAVR